MMKKNNVSKKFIAFGSRKLVKKSNVEIKKINFE